MPSTITLHASAKYGFGSKQYIARITGRDPKFTFSREFLGTKSGKHRQSSEYMTDEPGLYVTCDIDRKGNKEETYLLIEQDGDNNLKELTCEKQDAMRVAKLLDNGKSFSDAVKEVFPPPTPDQIIRDKIAKFKEKIAASEAKNDPEGIVPIECSLGSWNKGDTVRRADLIAFRKDEIVRLEIELNGLTPPETIPQITTAQKLKITLDDEVIHRCDSIELATQFVTQYMNNDGAWEQQGSPQSLVWLKNGKYLQIHPE